MNEEKLIISVQKYLELWNMSHNSYHDQERKTFLWDEIAQQNFLGKTGEECRNKWFSLRDGYRRNLRKRKLVTGQARKKLKPWRYEKEMEFLIPCFQERSQLSNLEGESDSNEDDFNDRESADVGDIASPVSTPALSPALSVQSQVSESVPTPIRPLKSKPGIKKQTKNPIRAAEVLQSYIENKPSKQPEDQLTKFFQAMKLSVRSLPRQMQVETKRQIFQIVNDAELKAITQEPYQQADFPRTVPRQSLQQSMSLSENNYPQNLPQVSQVHYNNIHQPPYYSQGPGHYGMAVPSNIPVSSTISQINHEQNSESNNMISQEYQTL